MANDKMGFGEAVKVLAAALADSKDANVRAALDVVQAGRSVRPAKENPFLAKFVKVGDKIHEDEVFQTFKLGRRDAYWVIADAIKVAPGSDGRKWIQFDEKTGIYELKGIGKTFPAGYAGYIPRAERTTK